MSSVLKSDVISSGGFPVGGRICDGQLAPVPAPFKYEGSAPEGILCAGYSETAQRFLLCTEKYVYDTLRLGYFIILSPLEGGSPFIVEEICGGKARTVVINGGKAVLIDRDTFSQVNLGASLSCGVMHCGRLFGADSSDKTLLRWSGEGGAEDWEEGLYGSGSLKLDIGRGEILNVLEFGEKLVIVRKYGLTVADMFGVPENFSVNITDTDTDEICPNTAAVVGGKLYFYTLSGLHSYDGSAVKRVATRFDGDVYSPLSAVGFDGVYYLSCKSKTAGGGAVMCYDVSGGESWLIDITADGMCALDSLYIFNATGSYSLKADGNFVYTSGKINFGTGGYKTLTKILIDGRGADVEVSNGRVSRIFKNASGAMKPRLRGKEFTVKVSCGNVVRSVTAEARVLNEI